MTARTGGPDPWMRWTPGPLNALRHDLARIVGAVDRFPPNAARSIAPGLPGQGGLAGGGRVQKLSTRATCDPLNHAPEPASGSS